MTKIPDYWITFLNRNELRGVEINIPEEDDISEMEVSLKVLKE